MTAKLNAHVACLLIAIALPNAALAEWVRMTTDDIKMALTDAKLTYDVARQEFYASGRTLYESGRPSWGTWEARGDQYCSQWPPASGWACYDMERDTATGNLRFIGESGDITEGTLSK